MYKKKILIILGHPDGKSFNGALASEYMKGATEAGYEVKLLLLGEIDFDLNLHKGYKEIQELEPDLVCAQEDIKWADHLVFIFPDWWGCFPAVLKGFIDRIFLPGFGFKYHKDSPLWDRLLKGKSARIITTMDGPNFLYRFFLCSAGVKIIKRAVLGFCGISPVRTTLIAGVKNLSVVQKEKQIEKIKKLGKKGK